MVTYTTKANARRAAKAKLGANVAEGTDYQIIEDGKGGFGFHVIQHKAQVVELTEATQPSSIEPQPEIVTIRTPRNRSAIENPVKLVWKIADDMASAKRKEIITEAVKRGVAFFTARTQYQKWREHRKVSTL